MTSPRDSTAMRVRLALPLLAAIVFLVLGFAFHAWRWAWIVYLIVPLGYVLLPNPAGRDRQRDRARRDPFRKDRGQGG